MRESPETTKIRLCFFFSSFICSPRSGLVYCTIELPLNRDDDELKTHVSLIGEVALV